MAAQKHGDKNVRPMKWYKLLRYRNIWAMCMASSPSITPPTSLSPGCQPTVKDKGMDFLKMGMVAALPLICGMVIEVLAGWASDRMVHKSAVADRHTQAVPDDWPADGAVHRVRAVHRFRVHDGTAAVYC